MAWNWKTLFTRQSNQPPTDQARSGVEGDRVGIYRDSPAQIEQQPKPKVAWALNSDEAHFNPAASVVSFRTLGFRNLAHPDSPIEYLEADYEPETQRWRLRQCSVGQGRALSAMFNRDVDGSTLPMPTQKSVTLVDRAAFMLVLQKMAVYEFGTDTASQYAMREVVEEDITSSYFMNIAHAAGVVFDVNGHPSMTRNGRPMRDGQFPQSELDHAAAYDDAQKPVPLPALLGSMPLAQQDSGLDSFDDFSTLLKFNKELGEVLEELDDLRRRYYVQTYQKDKNIYVYTDAKWPDLASGVIHDRFNYTVRKVDDALNVLVDNENNRDVAGSLVDIKVMMRVVQAATMMQCYHHKGGPSAAVVSVEFMKDALASADEALLSCESFSDERKKMIRGFIMGHHSVAETLTMFDAVVANVHAVSDASLRAEKASIQQSQVKIEAIPSRYEFPMAEFEGLASLGFIEEKFPAQSGPVPLERFKPTGMSKKLRKIKPPSPQP